MEIRLSQGLKKLQLEFCVILFYLALELLKLQKSYFTTQNYKNQALSRFVYVKEYNFLEY